MPQSGPAAEDAITTLIRHRRVVADLHRQIKRTRMVEVARLVGWLGVPLLFLMLATAIALTWRQFDMEPLNTVGFFAGVALAIGCTAFVIYFDTKQPASMTDDIGQIVQLQAKTSEELRLDLELAEEERVLAASKVARAAFERQYSYREVIPREIDRLRA